jgi:peptide-methionine (R)-S-oxide reductase
MCECKKNLNEFERYVICEKGTEPAFNNEYWDNKKAGIYMCKCCEKPLFSSEHKFDSSTGWPSFYMPIGEILEAPDFSGGMQRVEVMCAECGAHLGHLFGDGPMPTGLRYCINSTSLVFVSKYN